MDGINELFLRLKKIRDQLETLRSVRKGTRERRDQKYRQMDASEAAFTRVWRGQYTEAERNSDSGREYKAASVRRYMDVWEEILKFDKHLVQLDNQINAEEARLREAQLALWDEQDLKKSLMLGNPGSNW
ncbi:unnamed protein product [Clonostachys chloroleuca]|uniref:Uncharacterized protein n=1 Tax=Clonostachys chloroleuca TaxID=1926264 RepID=A0AA35MFZ2_9HYPO|nr:unnamed protein product [Clonostachys chloroleuca]